jgi:ABC-type Na+ efflux pump permease subunit
MGTFYFASLEPPIWMVVLNYAILLLAVVGFVTLLVLTWKRIRRSLGKRRS